MTLRETVKKAKADYHNKAKIKLEEGNKLVIRNTATNAIHPWINGKKFIQIGERDKAQIWDLINEK